MKHHAEEYPSSEAEPSGTASDVMLLLEVIRKGELIGEGTLRKMDEDQIGGNGLGVGFGIGWPVAINPKLVKTPQSKGTIS